MLNEIEKNCRDRKKKEREEEMHGLVGERVKAAREG